MPGLTGITPGNQTFSQIVKNLEPQMKKGGNGAYLRFTGAKGLYVKKGIDNRLFGDWIIRNNKFLDAASVIRDAIDRERQGIIVEGVSLGEYVVRTIMKEHPKEHRLTVGDLKKATQYIETGVKRGKRIDRAYRRRGPNVGVTGASTSRTAPSMGAINKGRERMRRAVIADLEAHFGPSAQEIDNEDSYDDDAFHNSESFGSFNDGPRNSATNAKKMAGSYMATLDHTGGLCEANLINLMDQFQKANIPHHNIAKLVDLTDLQRKIDVSGERLNEACHKLEAVRLNGKGAEDNARSLRDAIAKSRRLVHRMKNLPFPDGLERERNTLFESLKENYAGFRGILYFVRASDPENKDAIKALERATLETYDLAHACLSRADRNSGASAVTEPFHWDRDLKSDKNFTEVIKGFDDAAINEPVSVPKTLYKIHDTRKTMLLRHIVDAYNSALQIVKKAHADFMKAPTKDNLDELHISLETANRDNDRVLEGVARAGKIYGERRVPKAFLEQSDKLKRQRRELQILRGQATRLAESQSPKVGTGQGQAHGRYENQYDSDGLVSNASSYYLSEPVPSSISMDRNGLLGGNGNFNSANED
ncbi:MAG: hypothetical protein AAF936_08520 [Pseudomonadota bacterium]